MTVTDSLRCLAVNTQVSSVTDTTHLVLNKNAAAPCTTNTADTFYLTGGTGKSSGGSLEINQDIRNIPGASSRHAALRFAKQAKSSAYYDPISSSHLGNAGLGKVS